MTWKCAILRSILSIGLLAITLSGQMNVRNVQLQLKQAGFDPGPVDGVAGGRTTKAIRAFQKENRLPVTGRIDELTLVTLAMVAGTPSSEPLTSAAVETKVQKSHPTEAMRMKTGVPETIGPATGHGAKTVLPFRVYVEPIPSPNGKTLTSRP